MKSKSLVILISVAILMASCSKKNSTANLYVPSDADVTANATLAELQQGRTLYINNCGSCHDLISPDNYASYQWQTIVNSMGPRTSMNSSEILLVTKYVTRGK